MAETFDALVRLLHIVSGVMMAGGVVLWSTVILPGAQTLLPPPMRGPFLGVFFPRVSRYLVTTSLVAIGSGFLLMGTIFGFDAIGRVFTDTTYGLVLGSGALTAIGALAIGGAVIGPTGKRLLALGQAAPPSAAPSAEMVALQKRLKIAGTASLALTVATLVLMALAVNIRA